MLANPGQPQGGGNAPGQQQESDPAFDKAQHRINAAYMQSVMFPNDTIDARANQIIENFINSKLLDVGLKLAPDDLEVVDTPEGFWLEQLTGPVFKALTTLNFKVFSLRKLYNFKVIDGLNQYLDAYNGPDNTIILKMRSSKLKYVLEKAEIYKSEEFAVLAEPKIREQLVKEAQNLQKTDNEHKKSELSGVIDYLILKKGTKLSIPSVERDDYLQSPGYKLVTEGKAVAIGASVMSFYSIKGITKD